MREGPPDKIKKVEPLFFRHCLVFVFFSSFGDSLWPFFFFHGWVAGWVDGKCMLPLLVLGLLYRVLERNMFFGAGGSKKISFLFYSYHFTPPPLSAKKRSAFSSNPIHGAPFFSADLSPFFDLCKIFHDAWGGKEQIRYISGGFFIDGEN